ncbi:MAG: DMT family transporter [Alphaproteobacteria bacterium]|nr:MAG: DMT family transporter [Alphaproteobacteria bacterium]
MSERAEPRAPADHTSSTGRAAGWAAIALSVIIWAGYLVLARGVARQELSPAEIGALRFVPAALLFAPVWLRWGLKPARIRWRDAIIVGGAGGFGLVGFLAAGLAFAPAADGGVLTPATMPLFVAILARLLLGERFGALRRLGFGLILLGAIVIAGRELAVGGNGAWRGHLLLLCAALSWAAYTLAYRISGMTPAEGAAIIALWAGIGFVIWLAAEGFPLAGHGWRFIGFHILAQGVLTGFVATLAFHFALARLGTTRCAALAALVPGLAALGAWLALGEPVGPVRLAGLLLASAGVVLASGALRRGGG